MDRPLFIPDTPFDAVMPMEVRITVRDPNSRKTYEFSELRGDVLVDVDYDVPRIVDDRLLVTTPDMMKAFTMTVNHLQKGEEGVLVRMNVTSWPDPDPEPAAAVPEPPAEPDEVPDYPPEPMMADETVSTCEHCGDRIVLVNYSMGPSWVHQSAGASFSDGVHTYCKKTAATPKTVKPWEHDGHNPVQHRDGKPPWCRVCGWTSPRPAVAAKCIVPNQSMNPGFPPRTGRGIG